MQVTSITVEFERKVNPAQYESAGAKVSLSILVEGEEPAMLLTQVGALAREKCYEMLGLKAPATVTSGASTTTLTENSANPASAPTNTESEPERRRRRTKAEMEAARAAESLFSSASPSTDTKPATSQNTLLQEQYKTTAAPALFATAPAPSTVAPATGEEWDTAPAKEVTVTEVNALCSAFVNNHPDKKAVFMQEFNAIKLKHNAPQLPQMSQAGLKEVYDLVMKLKA